jgi:hypothetical protein
MAATLDGLTKINNEMPLAANLLKCISLAAGIFSMCLGPRFMQAVTNTSLVWTWAKGSGVIGDSASINVMT